MTQQNNNNPEDQHGLILSHLARRDFWLRLPASLETDFCREHDSRAVDGFSSMIGSVTLLYFGLGAALILLSGLSNMGFWPASYAVFLVLIVAAWLLSVADILRHNYQLYMSILVSIAVAFALVHPSIIYGSELYHLVHEGTIFVMVIVFLGINLRLPWALAASVAGGLIALQVVLQFDLPVDWALSSSTYLGGALLGVVLRYRDERHLRRESLHARLLVLDNERIQALANQLERLSFLDGLTGLANRRYFDSGLHKAWRSCQRDGTPLTVIMLDVDYFKPYNDFYGHQRGDQVLRELAQTISAQAVRPQDMVARYGGEEFVVLLPVVDADSAQQMAEKILQAVRQKNLPHEKSGCAAYVTVSAGVATRIPLPQMHPSSLVAAADAALYKAKHDGRDRWCQATE